MRESPFKLVALVLLVACNQPSAETPADSPVDATAATADAGFPPETTPADTAAGPDAALDSDTADAASEVADAACDCVGGCDCGPSPDPCAKLKCQDWNVCTIDTCANGACVHTSTAGSCDDGDACTEVDTCLDGMCTGGAAKVCDDGIGCTLDKCLPCMGCDFPMDPTQCNDGDGCTVDSCAALGCAHTPTCDDGNPCTLDTCNNLACQHAFIPGAGCCQSDVDASVTCDDQSPCTIDYCLQFQCQHTKPKWGCCMTAQDCDDNEPCTQDACDLSQPVGDHFQCASKAIPGCKDADCLSGAASPCDDGTACTIDYCDAVTLQCVHKPDNFGGCCATDFDCNFGNLAPCRIAKCSALHSCWQAPLTGESCGDGKVCDACGECVAE